MEQEQINTVIKSAINSVEELINSINEITAFIKHDIVKIPENIDEKNIKKQALELSNSTIESLVLYSILLIAISTSVKKDSTK